MFAASSAGSSSIMTRARRGCVVASGSRSRTLPSASRTASTVRIMRTSGLKKPLRRYYPQLESPGSLQSSRRAMSNNGSGAPDAAPWRLPDDLLNNRPPAPAPDRLGVPEGSRGEAPQRNPAC
jgi:hypothetical protein